MPRAGTAYIKVDGDFSSFHRQLAMEGRNLSRTINVKADTRGLRNLSSAFDDTTKHVTVAERRVRSFGGGVTSVNSQMAFLRNVFRLIKWPALIAGLGTAAQGASALAAGAIELTSALAPVTGLLATIPTAAIGFAQGMGTLQLATMGLSQALTDMQKQQAASGQAATTAASAQSNAAETVRNAENTLSDAHRTEARAQVDLTQAHRDATQALIDLRFAQEEAVLGEERAHLALRNARNEQQRIIRDQTSSDYERRNAALDVAEAELQVREARAENTQQTNDLNRAERKGVQGSDQVVQARQALRDAERSSTEAAKDLANANKDSAAQMAAASSQANLLQRQLKTMPPAAREFARFLYDLHPQFQQLREDAGQGLFPGVEKGIQAAMHNFPRLEHIVSATANSFGDVAEEAGKFLGRDGVGRDLETIGTQNAHRFKELGEAGIHVADALRRISIEASPLVDYLVDLTTQAADWVDESVKAGQKTGDLADFFTKTKHATQDLVDIGVDLTDVLLQIGHAAAPSGRTLLDELVDGTQSLRDWADSQHGHNSLKQFFDDARPSVEEMGKLVGDITVDFFKLTDDPNLPDFIRRLRVDFLPLLLQIVRTMTTQLGPELMDLFVQLSKVMNEVGTPALVTFVKLTTEALHTVNTLFDSIPGLASAAAVALSGFSLVKLLGFGKSGTEQSRISKIAAGLAYTFAEAFGVNFRSGPARTAMSNAAAVMSERFAGAAKYALGAALQGIAISDIIGDVSKGDTKQAGFEIGGEVAGGIAGFIAGGPAGAMVGGAIGEMLGGQVQAVAHGVEGLMTHTLTNIELATTALDQKGNAALRDLITHLRGTDQAINKHVIRQWVKAGDVSLAQAGRMIQALKDVNQATAKLAKDNAVRTGETLGQQIASDGKITTDEIKGIFSQLDALPPRARSIALDAMVNWLGVLRNMGTLSDKEFKQILGSAEDRFGHIDTTIKGHGKSADESLRDSFKGMAESGDKYSKLLRDTVEKNFRPMGVTMDTATKKGADAATANLKRAKTEGSQSAQDLNKNVSSTVFDLADAVFGGFMNIGDNANAALAALNVRKKVNFGLKRLTGDVAAAVGAGASSGGKGTPKRAKGGLVPGMGSGDKVPLHIGGQLAAMVEPHEYVSVANRTATASLMQWNSAVKRAKDGGVIAKLASGGPVKYALPWPGGTSQFGELDMGIDVGGTGPVFAMDSGEVVRPNFNFFGGSAPGSSTSGLVYKMDHPPKGYSPSSPYVYIYELFNPEGAGAKGGRVRAGELLGHITGGSGIEMGWAAGTSGVPLAQALGEDIAGRHGYPRGLPTSISLQNFIAAIQSGKHIAAGATAEAVNIAREVLTGPDGPFIDVGQNALDMVHTAAEHFVSAQAPAVTPGVAGTSGASSAFIPGGTGGVLKVMNNVLKGAGLESGTAIPAIMGNSYGESGWDPTVGPGGLFGFLVGEKSPAALRAYAARQHAEPYAVDTQTNFMLSTLPQSDRARLNSESLDAGVVDFLTNWEGAYPQGLSMRLEGAHKAASMGFKSGGILARLADGGLLDKTMPSGNTAQTILAAARINGRLTPGQVSAWNSMSERVREQHMGELNRMLGTNYYIRQDGTIKYMGGHGGGGAGETSSISGAASDIGHHAGNRPIVGAGAYDPTGDLGIYGGEILTPGKMPFTLDNVVSLLHAAGGDRERQGVLDWAQKQFTQQTDIGFLNEDGDLGGLLKVLRDQADTYGDNASFASRLSRSVNIDIPENADKSSLASLLSGISVMNPFTNEPLSWEELLWGIGDQSLSPGDTVSVDIPGMFQGLDQGDWLIKELDSLFNLRNNLIVDETTLAAVRKLVNDMVKSVEGPILGVINKRIADLEADLRDIAKQQREADRAFENERDALQKKLDARATQTENLQVQLAKEKKKPQTAQTRATINRIETELAKNAAEVDEIHKAADKNVKKHNSISDDLNKQKKALNGKLTAENAVHDAVNDTVLPMLTGRQSTLDSGATNLEDALDQVQGSGVSMDVLPILPDLGVLKGDIGNAQLDLYNLGRAQPTIAADKITKPDIMHIQELIEFSQAIQAGAFKTQPYGSQFAGFFATGGRIRAGQFGVAGEMGVPELIAGPATVVPGGGPAAAQSTIYVVVEDGAVDRDKIKVIAGEEFEVKIEKRDREQHNSWLAGAR